MWCYLFKSALAQEEPTKTSATFSLVNISEIPVISVEFLLQQKNLCKMFKRLNLKTHSVI